MPLGRRVIVARLGYQRLVLVAAAVTIALASTLLTALWVYAGAASTVSVRNAMAAESDAATGLALTTVSDSFAKAAGVDRLIRDAADDSFSSVGYDIARRARTTSTYTLPDRANEEADEELTVFGWYEDIASHADLIDGDWPEPPTGDGGPIQVAIPAGAAAVLGVQPGSGFPVVQRLDDVTVDVVVTGTYQVVDPTGWYWRSDPLTTTGTFLGQSFPLRGPLVVADQATLDEAVSKQGLTLAWHVGPHWPQAEASAVDLVTRALRSSIDDLQALDTGTTGPIRSDTRLDEILPAVARALVANRSMMVIPVLQLALLAAYTLLLAARLLLEHRRSELALLRARGVSTRQIIQLTVIEAAVLVIPGAVLAPVIALLLLRGVEGRGPFENLGGAIGTPGTSWWLVAAAAALLCGLALVLPALRRESTYVESQSERGRQGRRTAVQRAGVDVLMLGGAAIAYWQLRHYRLPVIEQSGGVTVDPLLVLGPSLVLFATALVALRALPWVARAAQTIAVARPSLGGALGAWQVSRRPLRYAGPALLLVFALAIGAMSTAYGASWSRSQEDQAVFQAGADLRVAAPPRVDVVPAFGQSADLAAAPGVDAVVPAWRGSVDLADASVELLAIDAAQAGEVVRMRSDLGPPIADLMAPLAAARPPTSGIELPGAPLELGLTLTAARSALEGGPVRAIPAEIRASVSLLLIDASGAMVRTAPLLAPLDGVAHEVVVDLGSLARGDTPQEVGTVAYPVRILGVDVRLPVQSEVLAEGIETSDPTDDYRFLASTVALTGLTADGVAVEIPAGLDFRSTTQSDVTVGSMGDEPLTGGLLLARATSGADPRLGTARIQMTLSRQSADLPIIVDEAAATAASADVGDTLLLSVNGLDYSALITAVVTAFPSTDPDIGVVVIDFQTWQGDQSARLNTVVSPNEWWISSVDPAATAVTLDERPALAPGLISAVRLSADLRGLGATTLGALLAGFAAALAFAAVGFTVNLLIGSRERLGEFAVLRAIGLSRRQILSMLLIEQAFLIILGLVIGLAIGAGVSALVVPLVVISPTATTTVPVVLLDLPWPMLGATAGGAAVLFAAIVVLAANRLQRSGLGSTLRLGEDA